MLFRRKNKVALLGSSHITALKRFVDSSDYTGSFKFTFFGGPGQSMRLLKAEDGKLSSNDKNLRDSFLKTSGNITNEINPEKYKSFYLHGLVSGSMLVQTIIKMDTYIKEGGFLSNALIEETFEKFIHGTLLHTTLEKLRQVTDKQAYVSLAPLPSEFITKTQKIYRFDDDRIDTCKQLLGMFEACLSRYLEKFGAQYIAQPDKSITRGIFTINDYMTGSKPLNDAVLKSQSQHDLIHANALYGELLVKALQKAI
ncbi:hypothetical protein KFE96_06820 [Kordiimonas sp. SCSIO 12603]|uniref:hypothetical protein n=1 Tax=Kordiimonas sp. SCSIO 12603 TaxID=2829596 RepID=UPI002107A40B|nr:hypothetical protein [Kordiimonas sp. SCSIO 12603]UTW60014.1 hypothetical protein KFE96_06820 [Kordiimonas sp. SCSIO 12603]